MRILKRRRSDAVLFKPADQTQTEPIVIAA
jgi:hypothetical protein